MRQTPLPSGSLPFVVTSGVSSHHLWAPTLHGDGKNALTGTLQTVRSDAVRRFFAPRHPRPIAVLLDVPCVAKNALTGTLQTAHYKTGA